MTLPIRYKVLKSPSKHTLVRYFYRTGEELNGWRCGSCATQKQRREILEEVSHAYVLRVVGTGICCRKCGMDFMT